MPPLRTTTHGKENSLGKSSSLNKDSTITQLANIGEHTDHRAAQCEGIQLTKGQTERTVEGVEKTHSSGKNPQGKSESGVEEGTE